MKATIKLIKKSRKFSEAYKKSIVADFESGKFSVSQLERLHKISNRSIYRWIYKYSPSSSGVILHIFKSSNHKRVFHKFILKPKVYFISIVNFSIFKRVTSIKKKKYLIDNTN